MLNKPQGVLTAMSDDRGRKTVADLVADCPGRVFPVGRLDYDSEGLLLMTNDGEAAYKITHPSHLVEKEYLVSVTGHADRVLEALSEPMVIEGYQIRPAKVAVYSREGPVTTLSITITEGRKRQVRLMCAAVGLSVRRLVRIREGILQLNDLPPGKWRYLYPDEIEYLKKQ